MPRTRCPAPPMLIALTLMAAWPAQAQTQRCTGPNGTYYSDRPCPGPSATRIGVIGPAPEAPPPRQPYARVPAPPGPAPEHQSYMSSECASLSDGLRTAASRGLSPATQQDLRRDYQRRCAGDEAQASQRLSQEQRRDREAQLAGHREAQQQAQREQLQQQRTVEQCGEMRRIVASKTQRLPSMTPGEVADFRRFESNFNERCGPRPQ